MRNAEPPAPTPDEIDRFEEQHGFAAFLKCQAAARALRLTRRGLGDGRIEPRQLERQGLSADLAEGYCRLLYGPPPPLPVRTRSAQRRAIR